MARPLRIEFEGALYHVMARVLGVRSCFMHSALLQSFADAFPKSLGSSLVSCIQPCYSRSQTLFRQLDLRMKTNADTHKLEGQARFPQRLAGIGNCCSTLPLALFRQESRDARISGTPNLALRPSG